MAGTRDEMAGNGAPPPSRRGQRASVATGDWPERLLNDEQRLAWLRLMRSENVGPVLFYQLIDRFGSAAAALEALPALAARGGRKRPRICPEERAAREMERLESLGARLVARGEPGYPPLLAHVEAPPPLLCLRGREAVAQLPPVAIVGARNASAGGRHMAREMAATLAREGYAIVSGMAAGIDAAAHEGALSAEGGTVAVLACGIDVPYPRFNANLMERIAEEGLLLTEMPPGTTPRPELFPRRNRLVAGMSLGTVVVEAARRSGSLITARLAAEEGRFVMAVPGSPLEPRAAGCNHLIREGAMLVRHAADVAEVLDVAAAQLKVVLSEAPPPIAPERGGEDGGIDGETAPPARPRPAADRKPASATSPAEPREEPSAGLHARLLELLGGTAVDQDTLLRECGEAPDVALAALMELELAGEVVRAADGRLRRARP